MSVDRYMSTNKGAERKKGVRQGEREEKQRGERERRKREGERERERGKQRERERDPCINGDSAAEPGEVLLSGCGVERIHRSKWEMGWNWGSPHPRTGP